MAERICYLERTCPLWRMKYSSRANSLLESSIFSSSRQAWREEEVYREAVGLYLRRLDRRAGALAAEHDATLSTSFEENGLVRVDPVRVEQAILVLVDNAVKYGPEGQSVSLRSAAGHGELRVDVEDQGPGIPETELPHVFDRFYRLPGVEEPGSGLGLSIAQTIAEAHGGRIEAESRPGEGTRMSFILPLLQERSQASYQSHQQEQETES